MTTLQPPSQTPLPAPRPAPPTGADDNGSRLDDLHPDSTTDHNVDRSFGQKAATLVVILLPLVALVVGMVLAWNHGFGPVQLSLLIVFYVATGMGITVGFHRLFTHRSFQTSRFFQAVFAILGSMAIEGSVSKWVASHRRHHQHSDREHDPHSPHNHEGGFWNVLKGFFNAHMGWLFQPYSKELARYSKDLDADPFIRALDRLFPLWIVLSLALPALLGGLLTMSWFGALMGLLWAGLVRIFLVHHVTWSINSVCHIWGAKPYRSHDESRNNAIFGVLAFGEGWHNNHHAFPTSARHGLAWWQIDTSYMLIWAMKKLGLAWDVRVPDAERMAMKKA